MAREKTAVKNASMNSVILKRGREKNLLQRHPWIFSDAIRHDGAGGHFCVSLIPSAHG
jgi:hypothetical protein